MGPDQLAELVDRTGMALLETSGCLVSRALLAKACPGTSLLPVWEALVADERVEVSGVYGTGSGPGLRSRLVSWIKSSAGAAGVLSSAAICLHGGNVGPERS